ncbi:MAG: hypothetical protein GEU83_12415 [Pseudonocardiaceae bacterium]|nr:hypothetical protein [Pseudonocardiaceae bacterium]
MNGVHRCGVPVILLLAVLVGCTRAGPDPPAGAAVGDRQLVAEYFAAANTAAQQGAAAQQRFLDATQHPDFRGARCPLDGATVVSEPAMSTLRPDPGWLPAGAAAPPRGIVHIVAVTATVRRDGVELGTQIGSRHVVVLDGRGYGFAPCLARP